MAATLALTTVGPWAGPADAADAAGNFAIKGAGAQTCGRLLADLAADGRNLALYGGWIEGYVTAVNQYEPGSFDATPWHSTETLIALLRSACAERPPETRLMDAAVALLQRLAPLRLAEASPLTGLRHGGRVVMIYDAVLAAALRRLAAEGFPTPEDAEGFGSAAAEAFEAFQRARGLPATGLPDQATLLELFHRPADGRPPPTDE